jgi:purine catabolism regulator
MGMEIMARASILTAEETGLSRVVRSATVIDAPDAIRWVKDHEFVVTSTYPFRNLTTGLISIVEQLAQRDVAAFGVKLTRFMKAIPIPALERARQLGLPIVSLPAELAWSDLISSILASVLDGHARDLARSNTVHRSFARLLRADAGLDTVMDLLHEFLNRPVILQVHDGEEENLRRPAAMMLPVGAATEIFQNHRFIKEAVDGFPDVRMVRSDPHRFCFTPLDEQSKSGNFIVAMEDGRPFSALDLECLIQARDTINQSLKQQRTSGNLRQERQNDLVRSLISRHIPSKTLKGIIAREKKADQPLASRYFACVIRYSDLGQTARTSLRARLGALMRKQPSILSLITPEDWALLLLPGDEACCQPDAFAETLHGLLDPLDQHPDGRKWSAAIGNLSDIENIAHAYEQTQQALTYGLHSRGYGNITKLDEIGVYRLLSHPAIQDDVLEYIRNWLQPLIDHDHTHRKQLVATLSVFLDANGNYRETARLMRLHHNTIRYRIEQIQRLSGRQDLGPQTRLRFQIAMLLTAVQGGTRIVPPRE